MPNVKDNNPLDTKKTVSLLTCSRRREMAEILPIRRETLFNQSINQPNIIEPTDIFTSPRKTNSLVDRFELNYCIVCFPTTVRHLSFNEKTDLIGRQIAKLFCRLLDPSF